MFEIFLTSFATLFVVVDPPGLAPLFVALTAGVPPERRRRVAIRGVAVGTGVLLVFGLFGEAVLELIGVGLPAFRISGGLMLFFIAMEMLFEKRDERRAKTAQGEIEHSDPGHDPSVFPLGTPLIAGPGAMASMILLIGQHSGDITAQLAVYVALLLVLALSLATFFAGGWMERMLGQTGISVVTRLLGVLLGALAVQFVLDGLKAYGVFPGLS
jgi:multiple antibiotic resistance protein